jgi:hypothetical protein
MTKFYITVLIILISTFAFAQNMKQIEISIRSPKDVIDLMNNEVDLEHSKFTKNNKLILFVSDREFTTIKSLGMEYSVLIDDWLSYYNSLPKLTPDEKQASILKSMNGFNVSGFGYGSMGGFYTYQEVVKQLDTMLYQFPNLITPKFSIGNSQEGRPLWVVKISDNPNVNENEPQAFFDGLIHAREPMSMACVLYFMWYLLENYGTNSEVTYLVNNREIYFLPVVNPDGYEYNRSTNPNGGGSWRKNRRNNSGSYGVDLNRNWGYKWGYDNIGSSPTPSSDTYRGPSAFSEPESYLIRDFVNSKNIKTYINYHSYNNSIIYPWAYIGSPLTPDSLTFMEYGSYMARFNGYDYGNGYQTLGYVSNGAARDWFYGDTTTKGKVFSYVFEVGTTGFWPSQSEIFPLAQANIRPNLFNSWVAGGYVQLNNYSFIPQYFNPGETVQMNVSVKNTGLSTIMGVQTQLVSLSNFVMVKSSPAVFDSIPKRTNVNIPMPFVITISANAPINQEHKLIIRTSTQGVIMSSDTISISLGVPNYVFRDTTNNPAALWAITYSPTSSPKWEATTTTFYSAPTSYADSKTGNYVSNATVTMSLTNQIDLTNLNLPKLCFWTKYDFESNYDCGVVLISTNNGITWTALQGKYSRPASGVGKQTPAGMPCYDGLKSNWIKEEINLSAYIGKLVKLRFELRSDGSQNKDGWYIDDIGIFQYQIVPVELISLNSSINGNDVQINWVIATEKNNKGFEIQKRDCKLQNADWKNIGFVEGNGTTTEVKNYSFIDKNVKPGKYSYRLSQVDYDGTCEYLQAIEVELTSPEVFKLEQNYPNPFNPSTTINYQVPKQTYVLLKIYDILGNEIVTLVNQEKEPGKYKVEFDLRKTESNNFTSGIYYYQLKAGEYTQIKKMIILK